MNKRYIVNVREHGQETFVDDFRTEMEAAQFIVDHKRLYDDDRFFDIEEREAELVTIGNADDYIEKAIGIIQDERINLKAANE